MDAGWYNDPGGNPDLARWHNGREWTPDTLVKASWLGPGKPPPPRKPRRFPRWGWLAAALGVIAVAALLITRGDGGTVATARVDGETVALTTPQQIAEALNAGGFSCTGFTAGDLETDEQFGPDPRNATGTCTHDGSEVTLDTLDDARHLKAYRSQGDALGCSFGEAFGVTEINYAYGNYWTAQPEDYLDIETMSQIAQVLGGEVHHKEC